MHRQHGVLEDGIWHAAWENLRQSSFPNILNWRPVTTCAGLVEHQTLVTLEVEGPASCALVELGVVLRIAINAICFSSAETVISFTATISTTAAVSTNIGTETFTSGYHLLMIPSLGGWWSAFWKNKKITSEHQHKLSLSLEATTLDFLLFWLCSPRTWAPWEFQAVAGKNVTSGQMSKQGGGENRATGILAVVQAVLGFYCLHSGGMNTAL